MPVYKLNKSTSCTFNIGVECSEHLNCDHCGWNPTVAAARINKMIRDGKFDSLAKHNPPYNSSYNVIPITIMRGM